MTPRSFAVRDAAAGEFPALARLWQAGWHDAHDGLVPPALVALRSYDNFLRRLPGYGDALRVAGPPGAPVGLCAVKGDEIDQLYVGAAARGTGVAAALIADAEARLAAAGVELGRLACAVGNARALRFYHKHGWGSAHRATVTVDGPFDLEVLVLSKPLAAGGGR